MTETVGTLAKEKRKISEISEPAEAPPAASPSLDQCIRLCEAVRLVDEYWTRINVNAEYRRATAGFRFTRATVHTASAYAEYLETLVENDHNQVKQVLPHLRAWLFKVYCLHCCDLSAWWRGMRVEIARCALVALVLEKTQLLIDDVALGPDYYPDYLRTVFAWIFESRQDQEVLARLFVE